jgi:hypothetical protein
MATREKIAQLVAERYHTSLITSTTDNFEEFKEDYKEKGQLKTDPHDYFTEIGDGIEANVYQVGQDRVLKVYDKPGSGRAEYVIFIDPQYQDVTPNAFDHAEDFTWIVVEKVDPITDDWEDWSSIKPYLPDLYRVIMEDRDATFFERKRTINDIIKRSDDSSFGEFYDISRKEQSWLRSIKKLYDDLGQKDRYDIKPDNLGEDSKGRLVLLDIFVYNLID